MNKPNTEQSNNAESSITQNASSPRGVMHAKWTYNAGLQRLESEEEGWGEEAIVPDLPTKTSDEEPQPTQEEKEEALRRDSSRFMTPEECFACFKEMQLSPVSGDEKERKTLSPEGMQSPLDRARA